MCKRVNTRRQNNLPKGPADRGGLALFILGGAMAQQGPVGRYQTVVGCGRFEKPNLNAIAIGDMMFHLIKPIVKEKSLQN